MGKVWIVSNVVDDVSAAARFGLLTQINKRYVYPDELQGQNNTLPTSFQYNLTRAANEFNAQEDYLLLAGDHVQMAMMIALLSYRCTIIRVLRWDRKVNTYVPITLEGFEGE